MLNRSLYSHKHVWSLFLSYTFLGLLLTVSACARIPNIIPDGYEGVFDDPARASTAARVDWAIPMAVDATKVPTDEPNDLTNAKSIGFRVTKNGERFWIIDHEFWDQKLWKPVTWYRISLIESGVTDAICGSDLTKAETDLITVPCTSYRDHDFTVKNHLSKPLVAMLSYWVGGNKNLKPNETDESTGLMSRLIFLFQKY